MAMLALLVFRIRTQCDTRATYDPTLADLARCMHAAGEPVKTIAEALGVSAATDYRVVAED